MRTVLEHVALALYRDDPCGDHTPWENPSPYWLGRAKSLIARLAKEGIVITACIPQVPHGTDKDG